MTRLFLIGLLALAACGSESLPQYELSGSAMGTTFTITLVDPDDGVAGERLGLGVRGEPFKGLRFF